MPSTEQLTTQPVSEKLGGGAYQNEFTDFAAGVQLGLEAEGQPPASVEALDQAFTVRRVAAHVIGLPRGVAARVKSESLVQLQSTPELRVKWTASMLRAALKLARYYPLAMEEDRLSRPSQEEVSTDATSELPALQVKDERVLAEEAEFAVSSPVVHDEAATSNLPPVPEVTHVATPQPRRRSRKAVARDKLSVNRLELPTIDTFTTVPGSLRSFQELEPGQQMEAVIQNVAERFDVDGELARGVLSRHKVGGFSPAEIALLSTMRERLCLQLDHKGVACSNGVFEPMQAYFRTNGKAVTAQVASFLGVMSAMQGKKRIIKAAAPKRPHESIGRSGNSSTGYRDLLYGVRYVALCEDK